MRRVVPVAIVLALSLVVVAGGAVYGQVKKDPKTGLDRIDGTIQSMNKEKSTLTLKQSTDAGLVWHVAYNSQTTFTYRNGPGKVEDMKEGVRIYALGKFEKDVLTASRIDIRSGK